MSARPQQNWNSRLHRLITTAPWTQTLQQQHEQRPGPTPAVTVTAIMFAIALLAQEGHAYKHTSALSALRRLPVKWQKKLGLPTRRATSKERNEYGRTRVADISYGQLAYTYHSIIDLLIDEAGDHMGPFITQMLHHSLPDHAKTCRSIAVDGTFHEAYVAHHPRDRLLADPRFDVDYPIREDENGKTTGMEKDDRPGYRFVTLHLFDPTDHIVSPYILGFAIGSGTAGESTLAIKALDHLKHVRTTINLAVVDGAFGSSPRFHAAVREFHGQAVFRPTKNQQNAIAQHPSGLTLYHGRALTPGIDLDPFMVDLDGQPWTNLRAPHNHPGKTTEQWLNDIDRFIENFQRLDPLTRRRITQPDLAGTYRVDLTPTHHDRLHGYTQPPARTRKTPPDQHPDNRPEYRPTSATIRPEDFPLNSYQDPPFGSAAWMYLHSAARSRNEGGMGDIRNHMMLQGNRGAGIRIRGRTRWQFMATILGMVRNLQLANELTSKTDQPRKRVSRRAYRPTKQQLDEFLRHYQRRERQLEQAEQEHTNGNDPPDSR